MRVSAARQTRVYRGMTLVEVMVAMAVAVVLFGIAMGVLVTTNRTAGHIIGHESLVQQAQLDMKRIRAVLENVVWPEDLATAPPEAASVGFAKNSLAVFSSHQPTTAGQFCLYSLGYKTEVGEEKPAVPGFFRRVPGKAAPERFIEFAESHEAAIEFRYATDVGENLKPVWKESLAAGQKPRLIWVELVLRDSKRFDPQGRPQQVRLQTAIAL